MLLFFGHSCGKKLNSKYNILIMNIARKEFETYLVKFQRGKSGVVYLNLTASTKVTLFY